MYRLSDRSLERLSTCHIDLELIMKFSLEYSMVDFGIAEGHRTVERQQELFNTILPNGNRLTKIDGVTRMGKHNYTPSMAVDTFAWVNGASSYNYETLCYIAGVITATAKILHTQKVIDHLIRWGGNWDGDGEIITDQGFQDLVHFELIN